MGRFCFLRFPSVKEKLLLLHWLLLPLLLVPRIDLGREGFSNERTAAIAVATHHFHETNGTATASLGSFSRRRRKNLANAEDDPKIVSRAVGEKELLVVRIQGTDGISTTLSKDELFHAIFQANNHHNDKSTTTTSLVEQFASCSKQQFLLRPAKGSPHIEDGIITVELDAVKGSTVRDIYQEIDERSKTTELFGRKLQDFDQVILCMPPGVHPPQLDQEEQKSTKTAWVAFVPTQWPYKNYLSIYNDQWCSSVSAMMHEVGHTLTLGHSGNNNSYDDETGQMGFSYKGQVGALRCFNAAKSWQLGWYANQSLRLDPLLDQLPVSTVLMGIASNFGNNDDNHGANHRNILLQIHNGPNNDPLFLGYNRGEGFNGETDGHDRVMVNQQKEGGPLDSKLLAVVDVNESFRLENYRGIAGTTLVIAFKERVYGMDGALVEISLEQSSQQQVVPSSSSDGCDISSQARFDVSIVTDDFPEDTSWTLTKDETGETIASKDSFFDPSTTSVDWACLDRDGSSYTFTLFDAYQDGMCCQEGFGGYSVFLDGKEVGRGGEFQNAPFVHHSFVVHPSSSTAHGSEGEEIIVASRGKCEDDVAYLFNNKTSRDCEWVGRLERRRKQKCIRNDPKTTRSISFHCPSVCLEDCRKKKKKKRRKRRN